MRKGESGSGEGVRGEGAGWERVTEAKVVAGDFDLVVEAEGEEVYDVLHSASNAIRGLTHVVDTKTYVCLE